MKFAQCLPLIFQLFCSLAFEEFQELSPDDECSEHAACSLHALQLQTGTSYQDLKDADDLDADDLDDLQDFGDDSETRGGDCRRRRWSGDCDTRRRDVPPPTTTPRPTSSPPRQYVLKQLGQNYCKAPEEKVWNQNECRNAARYFQQINGKPLQELAVFSGDPNMDVEASWGWVPVSCSLQTGWHKGIGTNTVVQGTYQGHFKSTGKNTPLDTLYQLICRKN
eukprot:Skav216731  [mRNA]  locus=scaffold653:150673:151630:+ [translate_table: standard]